MRILITGGAGFIGSHLVDFYLEKNCEVIVLDNFSSGFKENLRKNKNLKIIAGDVLNKNLVLSLTKGCDIVFHLAAFHPNTVGHIIKQSYADPLKDAKVTVLGSINVLEAARKNDCRVVLASTAAVYGNPIKNPVSEKSKIAPISPYGMSKYCAEIYFQRYYKIYGVEMSIARIFNTYGPRQFKYIHFDILERLRRNPNRLKVFGSGEEMRDFIFVKDTVTALSLLGEHEKALGEIFNIGSGEGIEIKKLITIMLNILKLNPVVVYTYRSWCGNVKKIYGDIKKIKKLGWKPKYSIEKGLKEFIKWYQEVRGKIR
ncbi:MAG: GDP-mannose 4,6-dehydratase [Candidatus Aenigmarchaeota archaeon]|nr:GDP-mannose 4,6-dehydratase [Candidatus Aenigmarchaeota archaeon]MDW8149386.1 GDP-mannose 4,6-dehydratase [Candidatus Aenigmarchaeota archaeon]